MTAIRSSARSVPSMACSRIACKWRFVPSRFSVKIRTRRSFQRGAAAAGGRPNGGNAGHIRSRIQSMSRRVFASGTWRA